MSTPTATASPAPEPASAGSAAASTAAGPELDAIVAVWEDDLLPKLAPAAKARYRGGRFAGVDAGTAVFALPNEMHRQRCDEFRPDVEALLAGHFGQPVPLRLVVDAEVVEAGLAAPTSAGGGGGADAPTPVVTEPEEEESIDPAELVDATGEDQSAVERLAEVFGSVEVIEEEAQET